MSYLFQILINLTSSTFLAIIEMSVTIFAGQILWLLLMKRRASSLEIFGPVFVLGHIPLTAFAALLISWFQCATLVAIVGISLISFVGLYIWRLESIWASLRSLSILIIDTARQHPLLFTVFMLICIGELLVCSVPNTNFDSYNLHYAISEDWRRLGSLVPHGYNAREYGHLNGELMIALWMSVAGERAANVLGFLQVLSLGVSIVLLVKTNLKAIWHYPLFLTVFTFPVAIHQAGGGMVDCLLVLAAVCTLWSVNTSGLFKSAMASAVMAGLFAGYCWGIKQSAPVLLFPIFVIVFLDIATRKRYWRYLMVSSSACLAVTFPWLLRTFLTTGNPFYPSLPRLTRINTSLDLTTTLAHYTLPFGPLQMLLDAAAPGRLFDDGFPPWVLMVSTIGAVVWIQTKSRTASVTSIWFVAVCFLCIAYVIFPGYPRYALFGFTLLVPALYASLSIGERLQGITYFSIYGTVTLSIALALMIVGAKVLNRNRVLCGLETPDQFRLARYPEIGLLRQVRHKAREGDGVLVFDGLSYLNQLPTYNADPRGRSPHIRDWGKSNLRDIVDDMRKSHIRWIILSPEWDLYRPAITAWFQRNYHRSSVSTDDVKTACSQFFPEWQWRIGPQSGTVTHDTRFTKIVQKWVLIRPYLRPIVSVPGMSLYEFAPNNSPSNRAH